MSGRIPREFIDDLLVRIDIVDLIDSHVPLKKAGSSYVARCPFHTEKSPSFSVNRKKQFYHCFGCGAGGNAVSFLMEFSHLDFVEAIEDLASFAGVDVPREAADYSSKKQDYSGLYAILEQVAVFYVEQLRKSSQGAKAVEYLKSRGLSGEIAKTFSLGYAPNEWGALATRFDNQLLIDAGMLVKKDDGKVYDRFRGRLVFPIRDKRKRVIGFGGRVLDDSLPKYLNSPETAIFSKGRELYGLSELLDKLSKPKRILIVEGYMDVLALSQFGVAYSVAALGTATSKTHLDLLFRFTSELVFCFDGDMAGQKAAWRAVQEAFPCLKDGRQIKVMLLPQGQDPDSLIRREGLEAFEERVQASQVLSAYFFEYLCKDIDLSVVEGRSQLLSEAKPYVEKIPAGFFREMMVARLKELSVSPVMEVFENPAMLEESNHSRTVGVKRHEGQVKLSPVRIVIALLLQNPGLIEFVEQREAEWLDVDFPGMAVLKEVIQAIETVKQKDTAVLSEYFRGKPSEKVVNTLINWDFFILEQGVEAEFSGALNRLLEQMEEVVLNQLLMKEKSEGLSQDEKSQLRKLLVGKR
ncbi:MAG: DNA primase [Methylococcales bacterium]|nr:DNA primase [Methylococcales bacterium]